MESPEIAENDAKEIKGVWWQTLGWKQKWILLIKGEANGRMRRSMQHHSPMKNEYHLHMKLSKFKRSNEELL